jgi:hypothetical protein
MFGVILSVVLKNFLVVLIVNLVLLSEPLGHEWLLPLISRLIDRHNDKILLYKLVEVLLILNLFLRNVTFCLRYLGASKDIRWYIYALETPNFMELLFRWGKLINKLPIIFQYEQVSSTKWTWPSHLSTLSLFLNSSIPFLQDLWH